MAQQPFYKGIPQKKDATGVLRVNPADKAKLIQKVVDANKGVQKEIPDIVLKAVDPRQLEARNKKREFDQKQRIETPIRVPTSHGDKWVKVAGWNNLTVDQKAAKRNDLAKEYDDEMASQGVKPTRPAPPRLATSGEAVSEGSALFQNARDAVYGAVNQAGRTAQMVNPGLAGFEAFRQVGGNALSSGLRSASEFVKDKENAVTGNALKDVSGTGTLYDLLDPSKILEGLVHTPSSILSSAANLVDPKTDTVGQIQSGFEIGSNFLPGYLAAAKGVKVGKNLLKGGASPSTAVGQGVKATALNLLGSNAPDVPPNLSAPRVAGDASLLPTSQADNFSDAIGAPRAAAKGADDVSGIVPSFRQPIAKMPESRIDSLSPQGRAIESWAGANLQKLLDNGVGEDLRTWDAVGKHYGSGAVPRNPEEFKYWVNDLVRTVDENDRNLSLSTEFATKDYVREMQDLRKLVSRSTPIPVNADPVKTIVGLQRQGNGWRVVPNPQLIPLSNVPEPFRLSVLENMRDGEMRYTTRANYQSWKDQGKPDSGVLRTRTASELALSEMGGDQSLSDFVTNIGRDGGSDILVPRDAVRAFVRNHFNQQTRAGRAAAAMRKPVKPEDFDAAVKYYNSEAVSAPVETVPTAKPVEMKSPVASKPKAPTPQVQTDQVDVPAASAPRNVTGVSNNIQLTKFEEGILKESPVGKGMTKDEFQVMVADAGRRIDAGELNANAVADAVEKGKALDSYDLATIKAGNRRFEAATIKLQTQLDAAIAKGDDATIVSIQKQVDKSRQDHLEYLEKVQKGKSEWSNVGRLMAQGLDVDSDTLTGTIANAQRAAGKTIDKLDAPVREELTKIGTELETINKQLADLTAENKRLQKLIADGKAPGYKRAEIQVRREKAITNIRTKWAENKPEARISSDPLMAGRAADELARLAKIAPDVVELAKTYIAEGVDVVSDILKRIKSDTDVDLTEDDFNLVLSGEYRQFNTPKIEGAVNFEDVNKAFAKMVNDEKIADLRRQARNAPIAQRSRIQKSIRKLEAQIKVQQLPNARAKSQVDADTQKLIQKRESARVQRDDIFAQLKDKRERELHPGKTLALEYINAPKSLVLSLDNSAPMTHGAFLIGSHPIIWAKASWKSIDALFSDANRVKSLASIRSDPYFDKAVGAGKVKGLAARDLNDAAPYSGILGRAKVVGGLFRASDRAMEVFGAKARLELFKSYAKAEESGWLTRFYKANPDYAAIGEAVNTMTGRGTGKVAEGVGKAFGTVATAPTYTVSRFKLAMATPAFNAAIRKQPVLAARVVADYAKYVGTTIAGLTVASKYGMEVEWDDSSSNYLKYKIPGTSVWIDPSGGVLQPFRLALQMKTKDPAVTGGFFIAGKAAPLVRSAMNLQAGLRGKKQFGKSYDPETAEGRINLLFQFAPLSAQNITEIKNEPNLTAEQKTALVIASFFGTNVNVKEGTDKK